MENKQKILVCGDVRGNFKQLFNRVEMINKKSGPFELLLCVGEFFGIDSNDELQAYINGNKHVNVPTYILGPNTAETNLQYANLKDGEICSNLTFLGNRGLYTASSGIKIAYVSGVESSDKDKQNWNFDESDVKAVRNSCLVNKTTMGEYRGVDILITSQWPQGIHEPDTNTSKLLSWLASEIKPRYHFCGSNGIYYERLPYRNSAGPNTQLELATRFISLASIGNADKRKYIYALSIAAVDKMRLLELVQKTTTETPCPYDSMNLMKELSSAQANNSSAQFFYDTNSFNQNDHNDGHNKRKGFGNGNGDRKRPKQNFDQEKCWFCLSSTSVEKHLVITVGEHFYLALAKGPIDDTHCLILPVTHIQCSALLSKESWTELDQFKTALRKMFKSQGKVTTFFERHYRSSHLQINVMAVDLAIEWQIKNSFEDIAEKYSLTMDVLPALTDAADLPPQGPYFVAELPDNTTLLTRQMKTFPLHFGREVFCAENVLNCEDKVDWKECSLAKDEEISLVKQIRESFRPVDFTL